MSVSRYVVDGPVVVIPAKIALLLERTLKLDELRIRVRGHNAEIDDVLSAWHAVAMQYTDEVSASDPGSRNDRPPEAGRESTQKPLTAQQVADRAGVADRAIRLAASEGRLNGRYDGGQWRFDPIDVAAYLATRRAA